MSVILAYIDPGSGSLLIQVLIAAVISVPFLIKSRIQQGIARLRGATPDRNRAEHLDDNQTS